MFSEYASKFLQQSQTRMSAIRDGRNHTQMSAPLFHSVAEFLPEDPEHEQDRLDLFALERSRRHFGAYAPSSATGGEDEDDDDVGCSEEEDSTQELRRSRGKGRFGTIMSSWSADQSGTVKGSLSGLARSHGAETGAASAKGKMVDVRLDDPNDRSLMEDFDRGPPSDIAIDMSRDESPPPFQQFQRPRRESSPSASLAFVPHLEHEDEETAGRAPSMPRESERPKQQQSTIPQQVYHPSLEPPTHDKLWGSLYIFLMAGMFTTSFVVWLHTEEINNSRDTIYNTLHGSLHLLAIDTFVAIAVALGWMFLLKSFARPLIYFIMVSVPVVLVAFSIYPFVMSFKVPEKSYGGQGTVMRWGSIIPAIMSVVWAYSAWRNRYALARSVDIVQLACRIIQGNPALVLLSFGTLVGTCVFSWVWVGMFTRVFLTGNSTVRNVISWKLRGRTVALGIYYIIMYLWTLGVASSIHRATSAATVSQWYFHRHAIPKPSSRAIMAAAFQHSTSTLFGSVCLSSLLALMVRLPLFVAPRYVARIIHICCYAFVPSPIAAIVDPLTLTYSAIHSLPILAASKATANLKFMDTAGYGPQRHPRVAYRLSKMLLTAARSVTATCLGIGAWIAAARHVNGGSLYGYLVGLIAGCIGWAIIGATEGCLTNVVDACAVCVASEGSEGTHCREAQAAFGG